MANPFDGIYTPKFDGDGNMEVNSNVRAGTKHNDFSHNWCDKCTWYQESTKAAGEALSDSGDGKTFNSANNYWIDLSHGRMTDEDRILSEEVATANDWVPIITVDDVVQTSDFTIDYENGNVTFVNSQSGTVKATYWYAGSGTFIVAVPAGKKLQLLRVEIQFSKNIVLNDTMIFTPKGYAGAFAPTLVPETYAATDRIELQKPNKYKGAKDFINESNGSYPIIPAWGGLANDVVILVWDYVARTDMDGDSGMAIEISMENNTPHTGEIAVATFYGILKDN